MTDTMSDDTQPAARLRTAVSGIARDLQDLANTPAARDRRKREQEEARAEGRKALARLQKLTGGDGGAAAGVNPILLTGPVGQAIETLEAAVMTLDHIGGLLEQAHELTTAAAGLKDEGPRALCAERYDELRDEIDRIARTAYANRINLLDGLGQSLHVPMDGRGRSSVVIDGLDATCGETGLALPPPAGGFAETAEIAAIGAGVDAARARLQEYAARLQLEAALLAARLEDEARPNGRRPD